MAVKKSIAAVTMSVMAFGSFGSVLTQVAYAEVTNAPVTTPATGITMTDATLNGTNGMSDASDASFWVSTSTFSTAVPGLPTGVYSTPSLGPVASTTNYSALLSSVSGLPSVTPNTTYYFVAWSNVGGTWSPGEILTFTTMPVPVVNNPVTSVATGVTTSDATMNALNGSSDAIGHSFWISTSTFSTASPTIPGGVYSTVDLGAIASTTPFSAVASSATGLPAITPNTTYYFAAWSNVGGTWYPGEILTFTTLPVPVTNNPVTMSATGITASDAALNALNGASDATDASFWVSTSTFSTAVPVLPADVYSTPSLGPVGSTTNYSAALTTVIGLPAITPNTTYYFAAWSNVGGTWSPGAVLNFTTASSTGTSTGGTIGGDVTGGVATSTGALHVDGITAVKTTAVANGTFADGWKYVFNITIPTNETHLSMKFADWMSTVGSTTLPAANNMRISSAQADNAGATILVTAANTYTVPTLNMTSDLNGALAGKQVQVTVEVAVPSTTVNGSYTTSYGVKTQ